MQKALVQYTIGALLVAIIDPFSFISSISFLNGFFSFLVVSSLLASIMIIGLRKLKKTEDWLNEALSFFFSYIITATILWFYWGENGFRTFLIYISSFLLVAAIVLLFRFVIYQGNNKSKIKKAKNSVKDDSGDFYEDEPPMMQIKSTKGKVILEEVCNNVLYFESNDNYVLVYFIKDGSLTKIMERISLKKIEEQLDEHNAFTRVHKSYIVNKNKVEEIKGKSQSYRLKMKHIEFEIPVSRSFDISTLQA